VPVVVSTPDISSRHSAILAIIARILSLIRLGAIPSAQFILVSAVALFAGVFDHDQSAMTRTPLAIRQSEVAKCFFSSAIICCTGFFDGGEITNMAALANSHPWT